MRTKMSPPKRRAPDDSDSLTGEQFVKMRAAFDMTQAEFAKLLGVDLRTITRLESKEKRAKPIPLSHAKFVRCLAREHGIDVKKALR